MSKEEFRFKNRHLEICRVAWNWWGINLNSGHGEHKPYLRFCAFGFWLSINLPLWALQPARRKVSASTWDAATVLRMGRDWYWDETRREFGIDFHGDAFTVHYGIQPDSWPGDKSIRWTPPWMKWRYLGTKYFGLDGTIFMQLTTRTLSYDETKALEATVPTMSFECTDIDGELIWATVRMEESEYACGEGRWAWLGMLRARRFHPRYNIEFSKETGRGKGSWKGGCNACSGPSKPGELHEIAFRRYCAENGMTFIQAI